MTTVAVCPNRDCGRVSHFGGDPLGRIFRCGRCGSKLSGRTLAYGPATAARQAPRRSERKVPARTLGAARFGGFGRFEVRRLLSRSDAGAVYLAFDPTRGADVQVTVWNPAEGEARERLVNAARSLVGLGHAGLARVIDVLEGRGCVSVVSERLTGPTFDTLPSGDRLDLDQAVGLAAGIAEALDFAHARDVIHGDLHAGQVVLGASGGPVLTNFGLPGLPRSAASSWSVSPASLAPARLSADPGGQSDATAGADQYALGVLLYELLCGLPPFVGPSDRVFDDARRADPPPLRSYRRDVSRSLERICLKAMAKEPGRRHASCGVFSEALRDWSVAENGRTTIAVMARWPLRRPAAALSWMLGLSWSGHW